jgi:hypothetical protein
MDDDQDFNKDFVDKRICYVVPPEGPFAQIRRDSPLHKGITISLTFCVLNFMSNTKVFNDAGEYDASYLPMIKVVSDKIRTLKDQIGIVKCAHIDNLLWTLASHNAGYTDITLEQLGKLFRKTDQIHEKYSHISQHMAKEAAAAKAAEEAVAAKAAERAAAAKATEEAAAAKAAEEAAAARAAEENAKLRRLKKKQKARERQERRRELLTCSICFEGVKDHIAYPCGHQCVCKSCAQELDGKPCPICRANVLQWMMVRIS